MYIVCNLSQHELPSLVKHLLVNVISKEERHVIIAESTLCKSFIYTPCGIESERQKKAVKHYI